MAGTLTHVFVSTHLESGSSIGLVSANEWNSSHALSGTWDSSQITSVSAGQITGLIAGSQIATIGSSQLSDTVLSSQIASLGSSQLTGTVLSSQINTVLSSQVTLGIAFGSSFITTYPTSQITVGTSSNAFTSSYVQTLGSTQITGTFGSSYITGTFGSSYITGTFGTSYITVGASSLAFTSSYVQTLGSSQIVVGTSQVAFASSQLTAPGANTNLIYNSAGLFGADATLTYTANGGPLVINNSTVVGQTGVDNANLSIFAQPNGPGVGGISMYAYTGFDNNPLLNWYFTRGATPSSQAAIQQGDFIGQMNFFGSDGFAFQKVASVISIANAAFSSQSTPNRLDFQFSSGAGAGYGTRMQITSSGILQTTQSGKTMIVNTAVALHYQAAFGGL